MTRGMGHVYQRGRIWWIKYYVDHEPRFESSESEKKTDAMNLLKRRLGKPQRIKVGNLTVEDVIKDYLAYQKVNRPKSYDTFAVPTTRHLCRGIGSHRATKVSPLTIREYTNERQASGAKNSSINREMSVLRRAFNLAVEAGKIDRDSVPKFRFLPEDAPRKGFVEPEQYQRLLDAMPEDLKPALVMGFHTGLRKSKVLGLRLEQFDLARGIITMEADAEGSTKQVAKALPIYGAMVEFVREHIEKTRRNLPNCHWFCHRADGSPVMEIRPSWDYAVKAAGMPGLLFHDLRRSAVRNMERAGVPRSVAMKISGHKTESVYRRYDIVSERDLSEAGEKLATYLGTKTKGAA